MRAYHALYSILISPEIGQYGWVREQTFLRQLYEYSDQVKSKVFSQLVKHKSENKTPTIKSTCFVTREARHKHFVIGTEVRLR